MDKKKSPLKKVVGLDNIGRDVLECGHHIYAPQDIAGKIEANRRRCWKCGKAQIAYIERESGGYK